MCHPIEQDTSRPEANVRCPRCAVVVDTIPTKAGDGPAVTRDRRLAGGGGPTPQVSENL